jgi:hypothetical protein
MTLDDQDIERIAAALARHLAEHTAAAADQGVRLVDAATVARRLGVTRNWVYAHADQLGVMRLGNGRGRLRFDLAKLPSRPPRDEQPAPEPRRCTPGRRRRARPAARPARRPVRLIPYLVESRHNIKAAGRRANAPGPTPGG